MEYFDTVIKYSSFGDARADRLGTGIHGNGQLFFFNADAIP
jgi:hypothetical protein